MAFDDSKTEPLIVVGCLSILCGLLAPVIGKLFGWWWSSFLFTPPVLVWLVCSWIWQRDDRAK